MTDETQQDFVIDEVKDAKVTITNVRVDLMQRNPQEIAKITFKTDKGDITLKPKAQVSEYQDGLEVVKTSPLLLKDIPQKIKDIAKECKAKGNIEQTVTYMCMTKIVDDETVIYRFVNSIKTILDKWA